MQLTDKLLSLIEGGELPPRQATLVVAVSGGVDSTSLLHLLLPLAAKYGWRLVAAHLNHNLRPEAAADERWVKKLGKQLGLPVVTRRSNVRAIAARSKFTLEEAGRIVRYQFLDRVKRQYRAFAVTTAHTLDDQAETVMFNWLRGTGVRGLTGMAEWYREWGYAIWRPLLSIPKSDLIEFSRALGLTYREDSSNRDLQYTRNRVRHQVFPALTKINPQVKVTIVRNAEQLKRLADFLDEYLVNVRASLKPRRTKGTISFPLADFRKLHQHIQNELLLWAVEEVLGDRQDFKAVHVDEMQKVIRSRERRSFKQLPGKLFLVKAYDKISVSQFKPPTNQL